MRAHLGTLVPIRYLNVIAFSLNDITIQVSRKDLPMAAATARTPKHRVVYTTIRKEIEAKKYQENDRLSDSELMARFGASRPTVARALNDLCREGLLYRRPGFGTCVKLPRPAKRRTIAVLMPYLPNGGVFGPICSEISRFSQAREVSLLWDDVRHVTHENVRQRIGTLCDHYVAEKVEGVFFAPVEKIADHVALNRQICDIFRANGIAVVLLDRDYPPYPDHSGFDVVSLDNSFAGFTLTEHLISIGRQRICFAAMEGSAASVDARAQGCFESMCRHGLVPQEQWVFLGDPANREFVKSICDTRAPDAIVAANDDTAALLMRTLNELDVRVPEKIGVVGVGDTDVATLLSVPLTTFSQPYEAIGAAALQTMESRIEYPAMAARSVLLRGQLIVRQSCGARSNRI